MACRTASSRQLSFFEKTVDSFAQLVEELQWLDLDSGVRTFGDYKGMKKQFVFVTRSPHDSYTLMVYSRSGKASKAVPGKRLLVREFNSNEELGKFMRGLLSKPLKAFVY